MSEYTTDKTKHDNNHVEKTGDILEFEFDRFVSMRCKQVSKNSMISSRQKQVKHYFCVLKTLDEKNEKVLRTFFTRKCSNKINIKPSVMEVLNCLAEDAANIENSNDILEWVSSQSINPFEDRVSQMYKIHRSTARKLKNFLGDTLYNKLLWG